jgi:protein ImuA
MHSSAPLPFACGFARGAVARASRWRPGLADACRHAEIFAPAGEASGAGLALALALDGAVARGDGRTTGRDGHAWLWVQDKAARRLGGRPYRPGLPAELRHRLIHVAADSCEDALFALEEGLRCRELAFVVGEIAGNPRALDLTASRRLSLAAEKHGVPLWLVRLGAARDLGSARLRWETRAARSGPPRWNAHAPGAPAWAAELFRAHTYQPGRWILRDDARLVAEPAAAPDHGDLVPGAGARSLAAR